MTARTADTPNVCGWTMDDGCCPKLAEAFEDVSIPGSPAIPGDPEIPEVLEYVGKDVIAQACVNQAAEILYALSGRQFGLCEVTVRPCREECCDSSSGPFSSYPWYPSLENGKWRNVRCCGGCKGTCSCSRICEVMLPGPIDSISEVLVDGVALDEDAYRVDNRTSLVRQDGECWPTCQEMGLPTTEEGTWSVTYLRGLALPVAGQAALGALACQLCLACLSSKDCCLPERVTSLVRQGITMALLDPMDFLDKGRTGIYAVDLWLSAVNPLGRSRRAHVFSPDVQPTRHQTWPGPV